MAHITFVNHKRILLCSTTVTFHSNIKHYGLQYDLTLHWYVKFVLQEQLMSYKLGPIMEIFLQKWCWFGISICL
jgi:hypothetical protein